MMIQDCLAKKLDDGHKVLIVNIYMPYDCCDINEDDFMY